MRHLIIKRLAAVLLCHLAVLSLLYAQDPPITWGEISRADLAMTSFPKDTNASALILCDYGESSFNNDLDIVFQRHLRVKILTAKGYEWGTHSVTLYTKEGTERIYDIEGVTYVLDEKANVVKSQLQEDDIFQEKVSDSRTRYRFTLPGLKPGCVIEIRYSIESKSLWFMRDWVFQRNEPVRWSEYRIRCPRSISYSAVTNGYEPLEINENVETSQIFSGIAASYLGSNIVQCAQIRWALKDAPALRDELYITTMDDYYNKVDVQLAGYAFVGSGVKKILNTWSSLVEELLDHKNFSQCIDNTRKVRKCAEEITSGLSVPEEKIKAIYDWTKKSIVWTGENRVFADREVNDVLESKKGNSADITFLLLSLLKSIGIEGDPVILSTRGNGKVQDLYPIISQFNYVLARVPAGQQTYYLDATDPLRLMELLPTKVLNVRGLVIKKGGIEWVTLTSPKRYIRSGLATIKLHEDGSLDGTFEEAYREYADLFERRDLKDKKEIDIARESFETEQAGITIDSVQMESKDSIHVPLKIKAWISSSGYAQSNGDFLYINPHILHRSKENPFKVQNRKFPIDYSYQRSYSTVAVYTLPDSFEVKEALRNRSFSVNSDMVLYSRIVKADSHQVKVATKLEILEIDIETKYYQELRDFYARIIAAESEQLVLARIKRPAVPPPQAPAPSKKEIKGRPQKKGKK